MANFAKKLDLDNHVLSYRARLKSDYDRKLRAKNFAKLYYLNKEYSKALRYLAEFMSVKNDCPAAYKLQGRIHEALLERDNAVQSYMKSLELDPSQGDLFDKIMELIPYTNLEPDKVKLWTEKLQLTRKDNDFLGKIKICSPCSPPGNITLDILNNSINDSGTPVSIRNPDLSLTERNDDIHSTPKSGRFASPKALSPYATKVNFEKIEKELILLSQATEGILSKVDKLQTDVTNKSSEMIGRIDDLRKILENINIDGSSGDLKKNLTDIKEIVYKHTEMMDKVMKSQISLEDAVYELTESYAGDTQGDGAAPQHDENKPIAGYSSYNPDSYAAANPYVSAPSDSTPKVESMFNPTGPGVFSRLGQSPGSGFMFQPPVQSNPPFSGSPYVPITPPTAEQSLPATTQASNIFQLSSSFSTNFSNPQSGSSSFGNYSSMPTVTGPFKTQLPTQTFSSSVAAESLKKSAAIDAAKPLSELWQPKGWECSACYTRNEPNSKRCAACETPAPGASPVSKAPVAFNFGVPSGTGSKADEAPNFSFSLPVKSQFDAPKDSSFKDSPKNQSYASVADTSFSSSNTSSNKSTDFSFKLDPVSNSGGSPSFPTFTTGSSPFNSSFGNANKPPSQPSIFGNTKSEPNKDGQSGVTIFGNIKSTFAFKDFNSDYQTNSKSPARESSSSNKPSHDVDLEIVYVKEPKSQQAAELAKKYQLPLNFYDYENVKPCPGCRGCDEDTPLEKLTSNQSAQPTETPSHLGSNLFAAAIAAHGATQSNWQTGKPNWSAITTPSPVFSSKPKEGEDDENFATGEDAGGSENAIFKLPTIQMPDIVEVKTGEEDEEPQFVSRAKIFLFSDKDKEWKERGVGEFKILRNPSNNSYRMLLRRDKVLKIACNQRISSGIKFEPLENSENALTWAGVDYSEEPEKPGKFCIKFKNKEIKNEFNNKVEDIKSKISSIGSPQSRGGDENTPTGNQPVQSAEPSAGSGSNLFAAAIQTYGTAQTNWETGKGPGWSTAPAPVFSKQSKGGDDDENFATGEDAGGSENAVFKLPTIQMPDIVEVKTGEEEEEPQFISRAKIFLFSDKDKEWKERGVGDFKILKHPKNNAYRMLLRRDKVLKIACNQRLSSAIKFEPLDNSENALTWAGVDYSEEPEKPGKFCIKFKNKELRDEFMEKVEDIKSTLSFAIV